MDDRAGLKRWTIIFASALALVSVFPTFYGMLVAPDGAVFLGYPYATDDHMVYAAWMKQAAEGRFLLDNRFTYDAQPGLTIHLYFWVLGLLSKVTGVVGATTLAKAGLTYLFVVLLSRFVSKMTSDSAAHKWAVSLACLGGGFGYLVWHTWGEAIVRPSAMSSLTGGRLPTDVWQPEGFVVPSLLTNSLFMAALCLMMGIALAILDASHSWKPVLGGAVCSLLLMNIHSYDMLLLGLVAIGLAVASKFGTGLDGKWTVRVATIFAGAIPSALWFLHVMQTDPVFQSRAATETYSPNFKAVVFGYLPLMFSAIAGWAILRREEKRATIGVVSFGALVLTLYVLSANHSGGYFLTTAPFVIVLAAALAIVVALRTDSDAYNLALSWAVVGLVAIYFPALFQRKLAMGLAIPWGILAGAGIGALVGRVEPSKRPLYSGITGVLCCVTAPLWLVREARFIKNDVSRTTVHELFLRKDEQEILAKLDAVSPAPRVIAMPGIANSEVDSGGRPLPDRFISPYLPDLNPILSGFAGVYTYAGHWSETPLYSAAIGGRRAESSAFFTRLWSDEQRRDFLTKHNVDFIVAPRPSAFPDLVNQGLIDVSSLGTVEYSGERFDLISVPH